MTAASTPAAAPDASAPEAGAEAPAAPAAARWEKVSALIRALPGVEPPIFPGPIPDRRAPPLGRGVRAQLEPARPVPTGLPPGGATAPRGASGGARPAPAAMRLQAPPNPARPRPLFLYTRSLPLKPPRRRREG